MHHFEFSAERYINTTSITKSKRRSGEQCLAAGKGVANKEAASIEVSNNWVI